MKYKSNKKELKKKQRKQLNVGSGFLNNLAAWLYSTLFAMINVELSAALINSEQISSTEFSWQVDLLGMDQNLKTSTAVNNGSRLWALKSL